MIYSLQITKVTDKDIQAIVALHKEVVSVVNSKFYPADVITDWLNEITEKNVRNQLKVTSTLWYLMTIDGEVVGFCQFPIAKKELYQINIKPKYLGKGYGRLLYTFIEAQFKENKVDRISLFSTINAKKFYESLGFTVLAPIKFPLENSTMDMFKMEKVLS